MQNNQFFLIFRILSDPTLYSSEYQTGQHAQFSFWKYNFVHFFCSLNLVKMIMIFMVVNDGKSMLPHYGGRWWWKHTSSWWWVNMKVYWLIMVIIDNESILPHLGNRWWWKYTAPSWWSVMMKVYCFISWDKHRQLQLQVSYDLRDRDCCATSLIHQIIVI